MKEFFKTEIEKIKREMKINTGFISDYHFDMGRRSAFGESQQAIKEALLKFEDKMCLVFYGELSIIRRIKQELNKIAKEDLGIDLDSQQDINKDNSVNQRYNCTTEKTGSADTHIKGCKQILNKWTFRKSGIPIEICCGDIIWNELTNVKERLLCSKCQRVIDLEEEK